MHTELSQKQIGHLQGLLDGEVETDPVLREAYAMDASPCYRYPMAVVFPRDAGACEALVRFALAEGVSLTPRGAGTSLAGQTVGRGLIVDLSRHMDAIMEIDPQRRRARVQPGVIPAVLNARLAPHGLMFAPDPSTRDRCCIGGMAGNNSWGLHAPRDGTTRDHVLAMEALLSDGSVVRFEALDTRQLAVRREQQDLEGRIYRGLSELIGSRLVSIRQHYPGFRGVPSNAGYALDTLARMRPWTPAGLALNLAPFLCGSEGTLALVTELELRLTPIPPHRTLVCLPFASLEAALAKVAGIMQKQPAALELLDPHILEFARQDPVQRSRCRWLPETTQALLLVEFSGDDEASVMAQAEELEKDLSVSAGTLLRGEAIDAVWELRRAGLQMIMDLPPERRAATGIEDTAVTVADLPAYVEAVHRVLARHGLEAVNYGPVSMGGMHIRPLLGRIDPGQTAPIEALLDEVAAITATFGGSLSAKHGDGLLRCRRVAATLGPELAVLMAGVKQLFDPRGIFNPEQSPGPQGQKPGKF